jgi:hypothetical protein
MRWRSWMLFGLALLTAGSVTQAAAPMSIWPNSCDVINTTTCALGVWRSGHTPAFTAIGPETNSADYPTIYPYDWCDFIFVGCKWYKLPGGPWPGDPKVYVIKEVPCGSGNFEVWERQELNGTWPNPPTYMWALIPPRECLPSTHPDYDAEVNWCPTGGPECDTTPCPCDGGGDPDPPGGGGLGAVPAPVPDPISIAATN